jgi:hypothetical protein
MSLNRYEQAVFDYLEHAPEEHRHWQTKVKTLLSSTPAGIGSHARELERELWAYLVERTPHVQSLRNLGLLGQSRVSMLNLAEYLIRLWGPQPKPRKPGERP